MVEILDKELRINVLNIENNPNFYYLSYLSDSKCIIETVYEGNNVIIIPNPVENCTAEELNAIINCFSNYIFKIKPELSGMLLKTEDNYLLNSIGFKSLGEDSDYLYKENKKINKVR